MNEWGKSNGLMLTKLRGNKSDFNIQLLKGAIGLDNFV